MTTALPKQIVHVSLNGINEKSAQELVSTQQYLTRCENVQIKSDGVLEPRYGYTSSPNNSIVLNKSRRVLKGDNILLMAGMYGVSQYNSSSYVVSNFYDHEVGANSPDHACQKLPSLDPDCIAVISNRTKGNVTESAVYSHCLEYLSGSGANSTQNPSNRVVLVATISQYDSAARTGQYMINMYAVDNSGNIVGNSARARLSSGAGDITSFNFLLVGTKAVVIYTVNGSANINYVYVDASTASLPSGMGVTSGTLATDFDNTNPLIAACSKNNASDGNPYLYLHYGATGSFYRRALYNSSLTLTSTTTPGPSSAGGGVGIWTSPDNYIVTYYSNGGTGTINKVNDTLFSTFGTLGSSITVDAAVGLVELVQLTPTTVGAGGILLYDFAVIRNDASYDTNCVGVKLNRIQITSSGTLPVGTFYALGCINDVLIGSRGVWLPDTKQALMRFAYTPYNNGVQSTTYFDGKDIVADITNAFTSLTDTTSLISSGDTLGVGHPVCAIASGLAAGDMNTTTSTCVLLSHANMNYSQYGSITTTARIKKALSYRSSGTGSNVTALYRLYYSSPYIYGSEKVNDVTFTSGGLPCVIDSTGIADSGFQCRPAIRSVTLAGSGSFTGSYSYVAVYMHVDNHGNVHLSAASDPVTVAASSNLTATASIVMPVLSRRMKPRNGITVLLFRTTNGGSVFHLIAESVIYTTGPASAVTPSVSLVDAGISDATVLAGQQLYYSPLVPGSPLARTGPPSLRMVINHLDRLFGIDDFGNIRFTGPYVSGEGQWWSDVFQFPVPGDDGKPVAIASIGGRLAIFKKNSIYAVDGEGPPENGGNGTEFSAPRREVGNIGCIDPRSIVSTPAGIFFRSVRGIELLSPNMSVSFIGESVQRTVKSFSSITGATYCRDQDCVKFLLQGLYNDSGDGITSDMTASTSWPWEEPSAGFTPSTVTTNGIVLCLYLKTGAWVTHGLAGHSLQFHSAFSDISYVKIDGQWCTVLVSNDGQFFREQVPQPTILSAGSREDTYAVSGTQQVNITLETGWLKLDSPNTKYRLYDCEAFGIRSSDHEVNLRVAYDYSASYTDSALFSTTVTNCTPEILKIQPSRERQYAARFKLVSGGITTTSYGAGNSARWLGLAFNIGVKQGLPNIPAVQKG